jgi:hypothetical protein
MRISRERAFQSFMATVLILGILVLIGFPNEAYAGGFNKKSLKGTFAGYQIQVGGAIPEGGFGLFKFDGNGTVTGKFFINTTSPSPPARITLIADITNGTYEMSPDMAGAGSAAATIDAGALGTFNLEFDFLILQASKPKSGPRMAKQIFGIARELSAAPIGALDEFMLVKR